MGLAYHCLATSGVCQSAQLKYGTNISVSRLEIKNISLDFTTECLNEMTPWLFKRSLTIRILIRGDRKVRRFTSQLGTTNNKDVKLLGPYVYVWFEHPTTKYSTRNNHKSVNYFIRWAQRQLWNWDCWDLYESDHSIG